MSIEMAGTDFKRGRRTELLLKLESLVRVVDSLSDASMRSISVCRSTTMRFRVLSYRESKREGVKEAVSTGRAEKGRKASQILQNRKSLSLLHTKI